MFLSTRNYDYLYKFIVGASKQSCENLSKESLELKIFEWKKFPSIHFCLKFIFFIISGKIFFKKDRARIKYKNVEIGRFITSQTYCRFDTYLNKVIFYKILFKNFLVAGRMFNACEYYYNKFSIKGVYVDHGGYLNGIIYSYFAQKKIPVYTNNYPHGIFFVDNKNNKKKYLEKYEEAIKINIKKKFQKNKKKNH